MSDISSASSTSRRRNIFCLLLTVTVCLLVISGFSYLSPSIPLLSTSSTLSSSSSSSSSSPSASTFSTNTDASIRTKAEEEESLPRRRGERNSGDDDDPVVANNNNKTNFETNENNNNNNNDRKEKAKSNFVQIGGHSVSKDKFLSIARMHALLERWDLWKVFPLPSVESLASSGNQNNQKGKGKGGGGAKRRSRKNLVSSSGAVGDNAIPSSSSSSSSTISDSLLPVEPFQPSPFPCADSVPDVPNNDAYDGCRLPGINNVLFTQHMRWFCVFRSGISGFQLRDRFCHKNSQEKIRYSSLIQLRFDKLASHFLATSSSSSLLVKDEEEENDNVMMNTSASNKKKKNDNNNAISSSSSSSTTRSQPPICGWRSKQHFQDEIFDEQKKRMKHRSCDTWFTNDFASSSNNAMIKSHTATCDESTPIRLCVQVALDAASNSLLEAADAFQSFSSSSESAEKEEEEENKKKKKKKKLPPSICWADFENKYQKKLPFCEWKDVPHFYFTPQFWKARRMIDFHSRYYIAARVLASMLFSSSSDVQKYQKKKNQLLPDFVTIHLRRGDYLHHCVKVSRGKVKPWFTFKKFPASKTSIFTGQNPIRLSAGNSSSSSTKKRVKQEKEEEEQQSSVPGCFPSLLDIERALDYVNELTGIENFLIMTNTPQDLIRAGIAEPISSQETDFRTYQKQKDAARAGNREWIARVLPLRVSKLFFANSRPVDDVVLEMALGSLGRFFVLNRYSSFSATVLEMAITHNHVKEDPSEWNNVLTW